MPRPHKDIKEPPEGNDKRKQVERARRLTRARGSARAKRLHGKSIERIGEANLSIGQEAERDRQLGTRFQRSSLPELFFLKEKNVTKLMQNKLDLKHISVSQIFCKFNKISRKLTLSS